MAAKVSLGFAALSDTQLDNFAQSVIDSMTGNAAYPAPLVTMASLQTAKNDFTTKVSTAQLAVPQTPRQKTIRGKHSGAANQWT